MQRLEYFMESEKEAIRLDTKTKLVSVENQAAWAGLTSGMRVADLGCGSGKTTIALSQMVQPGGDAIGIDISRQRIEHAKSHYRTDSVTFSEYDIRQPLTAFGKFDLIWIRFVLEYYRSQSYAIVKNVYQNLKPGGTICLIDLDHNCMSHYGFTDGLEEKVSKIIGALQKRLDFDPYVGRKLYSYLYDLGCEDLDVSMSAHHLIYGDVDESDLFNWTCKVEATRPLFDSDDAYRQFYDEFMGFFTDKRRFTYTPLIMCKGRKPLF